MIKLLLVLSRLNPTQTFLWSSKLSWKDLGGQCFYLMILMQESPRCFRNPKHQDPSAEYSTPGSLILVTTCFDNILQSYLFVWELYCPLFVVCVNNFWLFWYWLYIDGYWFKASVLPTHWCYKAFIFFAFYPKYTDWCKRLIFQFAKNTGRLFLRGKFTTFNM